MCNFNALCIMVNFNVLSFYKLLYLCKFSISTSGLLLCLWFPAALTRTEAANMPHLAQGGRSRPPGLCHTHGGLLHAVSFRREVWAVSRFLFGSASF